MKKGIMYVLLAFGTIAANSQSTTKSRSCDLGVNIKCDTGQYNHHYHAYPGNVVCTSTKELRHSILSLTRSART